VLKYVRSS